MKWLNLCGALIATFSMTAMADAGLHGLLGRGGCKSCSCTSTCQPACCKPVIVKPCSPNVYTYQRRCSDIKPPCCDTCCPSSCCAPASKCGLFGMHNHGSCNTCAAPATCCPAPKPACCAPAAACAPACAAPAANNCCPAPAACAPACAAPMACAPATNCAPTCGAPTSCFSGGCSPKFGLCKGGLFSKHASCAAPATCCPNTCAAPASSCCTQTACCADPCEIAQLIYESMTACHGKDRAKALKKLGRYECVCNPEIMCAFVYGLNDADEKVRARAADEIGDQVRKGNKGCGSCCACTPEVIAALTCALGDCDKKVRKQAEEALELCGYDVVDGCCNTCSATGCGTAGCNNACGISGYATPAPSAVPAPMPPAEAVPAPVPPEEKPSASRRGGLSQLLGLLD